MSSSSSEWAFPSDTYVPEVDAAPLPGWDEILKNFMMDDGYDQTRSFETFFFKVRGRGCKKNLTMFCSAVPSPILQTHADYTSFFPFAIHPSSPSFSPWGVSMCALHTSS